MDIGQQIRNLRLQHELTQTELGERTNLTKGYISQLEHNQSSPSMETFLAILDVLGQTPADFFNDGKQTQKFVYHVTDQVAHTNDDKGYVTNWLVPKSNDNTMDPVRIALKRGGSFKTFEPSAAQMFIYVIRGKIALQLGDDQYVATAGESMYFHATKPHKLLNQADEESDFILVATASYL